MDATKICSLSHLESRCHEITSFVCQCRNCAAVLATHDKLSDVVCYRPPLLSRLENSFKLWPSKQLSDLSTYTCRYRITLRRIFPILYNGPGMPLQNCRFPWGIRWILHLIHGSLVPLESTSPHLRRNLDSFSSFSTTHGQWSCPTDTQTDKQTNHAVSVAIGRIFAPRVCDAA